MSIQEQRNEPETSTQTTGGPRLTAANLDAHNRNTSTMPAGHAVRSWLNNTRTPGGRFVDSETWAGLVERDQLAADIDAAARIGNQNGAGQ
jgi:hypothetical protein